MNSLIILSIISSAFSQYAQSGAAGTNTNSVTGSGIIKSTSSGMAGSQSISGPTYNSMISQALLDGTAEAHGSGSSDIFSTTNLQSNGQALNLNGKTTINTGTNQNSNVLAQPKSNVATSGGSTGAAINSIFLKSYKAPIY